MKTNSEMESNKEETKQPESQPLHRKLLSYWPIGFKVIEMLLSVACVGLAYEPAKTTGLGQSRLHHVGVMYTAYTGYILINSVFLVSKAFRDKIPFKTSTVFSVCGATLFLITGILITVDKSYLTKHYFYHPQTYLIAMLQGSALFAFVNSGVFVADAIMTFQSQRDF